MSRERVGLVKLRPCDYKSELQEAWKEHWSIEVGLSHSSMGRHSIWNRWPFLLHDGPVSSLSFVALATICDTQCDRRCTSAHFFLFPFPFQTLLYWERNYGIHFSQWDTGKWQCSFISQSLKSHGICASFFWPHSWRLNPEPQNRLLGLAHGTLRNLTEMEMGGWMGG